MTSSTTEKNVGTCYLCKKEVSNRTVKKHLLHCIEQRQSQRNRSGRNAETFLVKVSAEKLFWLYIDINGKNTLADLDDLLRKTWLECCGHMSCFVINRNRYINDDEMNQKIQSVFYQGIRFQHQYDFGDTTTLQGEVVTVHSGELKKSPELLAQNHFPSDIVCDRCQAPPQHICSGCGDCFCKTCLEQHDDCEGEEFILPAVNSPRMGVCGYTGPEE